uniref:Major facilitator superfamily (MFS) profile domain-containing protein n=1 Tax=Panagrolaimus sp. PS1159 TaxID=55785 RepID=A0AC35GF58_9BILA
MRVSLSMAIVCMVHRKSGTNMTFSTDFQLAELSMRANDDKLNWSTSQITLILSATFYGGLLTMFWSGYLADRFTPKIVIVCAILDCVIVSGFTPFLAYKNFYALFAARVIMGLGEASLLDMKVFEIIKYRFQDFLGPAQASFITRCAWVLTWGLYSSDTPALHRHITKKERNYIETELQELGINQDKKSKKLYEGTVPWKSIITSWPIIVNIICQFTFNFSEAILSAFLPTYIDEVLQVSLDANGFLENFGVGIVFTSLALFVKKGRVPLAAMLFILCGMSFSAGISGYETSQASLAPQYVGILSSFLRAVASLGALAAINMVGYIDKTGTENEWTIIWIVAASLNIISGIIFLFCGSGDTQPWAQTSNTPKIKEAKKQ